MVMHRRIVRRASGAMVGTTPAVAATRVDKCAGTNAEVASAQATSVEVTSADRTREEMVSAATIIGAVKRRDVSSATRMATARRGTHRTDTVTHSSGTAEPVTLAEPTLEVRRGVILKDPVTRSANGRVARFASAAPEGTNGNGTSRPRAAQRNSQIARNSEVSFGLIEDVPLGRRHDQISVRRRQWQLKT